MWAFTCVSTQRESSWLLAATRKEAQSLNQTQEKCLHAVSVLCRLENSVPPRMCICYAYCAKRVVECKRVLCHKRIYGTMSGGSRNIKEPIWCRTIILKKISTPVGKFHKPRTGVKFFSDIHVQFWKSYGLGNELEHAGYLT
jgi:hypothetical protein